MKKVFCAFLLLAVLISGCVPSKSVSMAVPEPASWPNQAWQTASPEDQGMDSGLLAQMLEEAAAEGTNLYSMVIVRNGVVVTEAYFHPYTRDTATHVQSITKSVIGLLVGRAIALGKIKSVEETLVSYFPGRVFANPSEEKEAIRLSHLLSMTSGLDCQEFSGTGPKMEQSNGWVQFMLDLPVVAKPGTQFNYCNGSVHLLSAIVEKTTGMTAREFANQELFAPLGIAPVEKIDWGSDPKGYTLGGYGLHLRPVDVAKLALLALHNGKWAGEQLLPVDWMAESTTQHIAKEDGSGYGYLWTVYPEKGRYAALGLGGQQIHIVPQKNLIVVVTAGLNSYAEAPEIEKMLDTFILPAVKSDQPVAAAPENLKRLQMAIEGLANPVQPVAQLPAVAAEVSKSVYQFDENPFGWQQMQLVFTPNESSAQLFFNGGAEIAIGLDNLFRMTDSPQLGKVLLRGGWVDDQTFVVDYPYAMSGYPRLGELGETEMRFHFAGDTLEVENIPQIFGGETIRLTAHR